MLLGIWLGGPEIAPGTPARVAATTAPSRSAQLARTCRLSPRAYPKGVTGEVEYAGWVRDRVESLSRRIQSATDEPARIELLLCLANIRLARQAEPAATRWLLGDESEETRRELARTANTAKTEIRSAMELISRLERTSPPPRVAGKALRHWRQVAGQLSALAFAMETVGSTTRDLTAPAELEPLAKDQTTALGAAANLWRTAAIRQADQGQRILDALEPVLTKPNLLPYDFFQRLLHCRLLIDRGGYAVATALALRMEVEIENWFDKRQEPEAKRAVVIMQIGIAEKWADRLSGDQVTEHAAERRASAKRLTDQYSREKDAPVYRLGLAIPILVEAPEPTSAPVASRAATRPATPPAPQTSGA